jgi:CO/xanthine dehydrogenase FAD-binding subunit
MRPDNLHDALDALDSPNSKLVAGNTTLHYLARKGKLDHITKLVDISKLGISYIRVEEEQNGKSSPERNKKILIGAGTTFREVATSPMIDGSPEYSGLKEALNQNPPQIRNVATIGGSVCSAVSFYDVPVMLLALDATLKFLSKEGGEYLVPIGSFFQSPAQFEKSILLECQLPSSINSGSSFAKLCRRMSGYAILMTAAKVRLSQGSTEILDIQLAVGAITAVPLRLKKIEEMLRHKQPSIETVTSSCDASTGHIQDAVPSVHASVEYKMHVLPSLLRDVITSSVELAQEK